MIGAGRRGISPPRDAFDDNCAGETFAFVKIRRRRFSGRDKTVDVDALLSR